MVTFEEFIEWTTDEDKAELRKKVIALYPTFVKRGIVKINRNGKYELTENGSHALHIMIRATLFDDDISYIDQNAYLSVNGLIEFFDERNEYSITVPGFFSSLAYMIYVGNEEKDIMEMFERAQSCFEG